MKQNMNVNSLNNDTFKTANDITMPLCTAIEDKLNLSQK